MAKVKDLIFLGTGTSGSLPNIYCLTAPVPECEVCLSAVGRTPKDPPLADPSTPALLPSSVAFTSKNRRRNTSAIVRYMHSDGMMRTVVIDCGKTFYDSALEFFVYHKLRRIDAVILTHGHADAYLGMDDLRQWTLGGAQASVQDSIPVYLTSETMKAVQGAFPYLVNRNAATGGGQVSSLDFHIIDPNQPFMIEELQVTPIPVHHGRAGSEPYYSLGYRFENLTYISDTNYIPPESMQLIMGTKVLVLDALSEFEHASHFSINQAITAALQIVPEQLFLTDFAHRVDHDRLNRRLESHEGLLAAGIRAEAAFDGLKVVINEH
ncbi:beta-lactamase-like protein [Polychytrium aggregatum]|uniref:beta-lactamase-like protein n=1 Tax=Polychytrium aggregatum TaxID=110093 RepID=UPI0022FDD3C8|nr:beta-lactamase-like protein [Polychytrium aggregatum]KAI9205561.1 beta-lactamase-like protein [Polychytrium aggregatum]